MTKAENFRKIAAILQTKLNNFSKHFILITEEAELLKRDLENIRRLTQYEEALAEKISWEEDGYGNRTPLRRLLEEKASKTLTSGTTGATIESEMEYHLEGKNDKGQKITQFVGSPRQGASVLRANRLDEKEAKEALHKRYKEIFEDIDWMKTSDKPSVYSKSDIVKRIYKLLKEKKGKETEIITLIDALEALDFTIKSAMRATIKSLNGLDWTKSNAYNRGLLASAHKHIKVILMEKGASEKLLQRCTEYKSVAETMVVHILEFAYEEELIQGHKGEFEEE